MGIFSGCLLACDVDGTLTDSGYISPRNIEKTEYFMSEGGYFSLSTGRTAGAVGKVIAKLKRVSPSVVANGCMVFDFENDNVLYEEFLPPAALEIVKIAMNSGVDIGIEVHCGKTVYDIMSNAESRAHQEYEGMTVQKARFADLKGKRINKVLFAFATEEERISFKKIIGNENTEITFLDTVAEIENRTRYYHELLPFGVSKASALDKLTKMLKIDSGCLFAIGDYYNDLEMLKKADISAVTSETPDDIKQFADFVGGTCKDGAVADFIDYLTEKKKGLI